MKFTVKTSELRKALKIARRAIKTRAWPVLTCFRLLVKDGHLSVTATNLDQSVEAVIPVDQHAEGGVCVSADKLHAICESLSDGTMQCQVSGSAFEIVAGSSKPRLSIIDAKQFPNFEPDKSATFAISSDSLRKLFGVEYARNTNANETSFAMSSVGIALEKGVLTAEAMDGRRMAHAEQRVMSGVQQFDVRVPAGFIHLFHGLPGCTQDCTLSVGERLIELRAAHDGMATRVVSKLEESKLAKFLKQPDSAQAVLSRAELLSAITQSRIYCDQAYESIKLEFLDNALIVSINRGGEGSERKIDCKATVNQVLWMNPRLMCETLNAMDCDAVVLGKHPEFDALIIRPENDDGTVHVQGTMRDQTNV